MWWGIYIYIARWQGNNKHVSYVCFLIMPTTNVLNIFRSNKIVMPAEHTGAVLENYLWKVLLRRASGKDGTYIQAPSGVFDHELFSICWGPTLAVLSFIFDKSNHQTVYAKTIFGLR